VQEFWRRYRAMPPDSRHYYEILREGMPCHLYFDLEFDVTVNSRVDGAYATNCLLALVRDALQAQFQASFADGDVVQLDSSTDGACPLLYILQHLLTRASSPVAILRWPAQA
jgi:hypothetical protein